MTDEQFRALRQLILDQSVEIKALAMEVRALKRAVETTEIVYLGPDDIEAEPVDVPEDLKKFLPD
ncbi:hypothetical protein [Neorhizobium sp. LjRoot104]|uniref:hypothetical protein n=1 Tax=Neorhizobium sp. LjRoot104 TaxID=3342254 RepID=UPI003ED1613A